MCVPYLLIMWKFTGKSLDEIEHYWRDAATD